MFLSVWAEDKERSEKSLRGVFPFREVQQHNGNQQTPHFIHRQNLQDSNIHQNLHGSNDESQNSRRAKTQAHHVHHPQDAFHIEKGIKPNLNEYYYEDDHLIGDKSDEESIGEVFHHENLDKEVVIKKVSEKIFSLTLEQLQLQAKDVLIRLSW